MTTTLDPSLAVRGKLVAALKADAQLVAIVPSARIYPGKTPQGPTFPFIRVPVLIGTVATLTGGAGSEQTGSVHCFTKITAASPDAEAQAAMINAHIVRILSSVDAVDLGDGETLGLHVDQTQVIPDSAEADTYHGLVSVRATAS